MLSDQSMKVIFFKSYGKKFIKIVKGNNDDFSKAKVLADALKSIFLKL